MKTARILVATGLLLFTGGLRNATAQTLTTLYNFCSILDVDDNCLDGSFPNGIILGSDGNFYGTTSEGGTNGSGTAFQITPQGTLITLHTFCSVTDTNGDCLDGTTPSGLVQGTNGNFYGTTFDQGLNGGGTVFEVTSQGTFTTLYSFCSVTDSNGNCLDGYSGGALISGTNGNFYGTTTQGGANGEGALFQITPQGTLTVLYQFCSAPSCFDGGAVGGIVLGRDGNIYGTTSDGGSNFSGTVFQFTSQGTFTTLYSFCSVTDSNGNCLDGFNVGGLVQGTNGNFYGTTSGGGVNQGGVVFTVTPQGTLTTLYSFCSVTNSDGCLDGFSPNGLGLADDGTFYGTTTDGGLYGGGTVFQLTPQGTLTTEFSFCGPGGCFFDAANPQSGVVQGRDGNLYGTTHGNQAASTGTVYKLDLGLGPLSNNCAFAITPTNAAFIAAGGSNTVSVTTSNGCAWTATSNDGFITIAAGTNGIGSGTVRYTVAPNTSSNGLTGTMTIAGQTFTVTQSGASGGGCTYALSKTSVALTAKGGSKNVSVKVKGTGCSWTAVSNDSFITITSGSSGMGNGKVDYTLPGNTNTTPLTGTMTIAGQTFTVNQAAGGCAFRLSPKTGKIKVTGGTGTVKVTPNLSDCDWTAVSNDSFITITAGSSGTGKGTVGYSVAANASTNVLTGTMTIAGQTYAVTQPGAK